ncbi:hypothetical protein K493DRAFT_311676 [Basidiobolus meristosporus CBS 931.73]|uniref:PH domain-containing protein n=1 Tax=Basidiobolus meristosporus CBS 931.73 TaxID=1314790 RepID=A0A1Y1YZQ3_9FUNG|nr:hypothetical protein K493DRAFT_311676 [Basidiobolus meristosporus CBS 931.73]|eukprot:ORY03522.1 hypothetical protein K493DRAFT_311676 [Basidiobolus meristosporus CBS 931.73]
MTVTNKSLAHMQTLALLDGSKSRSMYSSDAASLSSPMLPRKRRPAFPQYVESRKQAGPSNLAKSLDGLRDTLQAIVQQRRVSREDSSSHSAEPSYQTKVNELLESLDACLDKVVSESESSGPSTPAELGHESHDLVSSRKYSNASVSSNNSEKSESSAYFAWSSEFSHSPKFFKDQGAATPHQIKEVTLNEAYMDAVLAGWLNKLRISNTFFHRKAWKRRLLVLTSTHLYQFKSSSGQSMSTNSMEITASTTATICDKYPEKRWVLELQNGLAHPWYIQAESLEDFKTWLNSLRAITIRSKYAVRTLPEVPLGNLYREMARRASANNVQTTKPRVPRPCKSMSHTQSSSLIQNGGNKSETHISNMYQQSRRQSRPRIDVQISQSPLFNDGLLANINCSPTEITFPPIVSKKSNTLATVMEC